MADDLHRPSRGRSNISRKLQVYPNRTGRLHEIRDSRADQIEEDDRRGRRALHARACTTIQFMT